MPSQLTDIIKCNRFEYECELGFHSYEAGIKQKIALDLEVSVSRLALQDFDKVQAIRFDYYEANKMLGQMLENKKFNLIESLAEEVAQTLLSQFNICAIQVSLTKFPADMANTESVTYVCYREKQTRT